MRCENFDISVEESDDGFVFNLLCVNVGFKTIYYGTVGWSYTMG
jgi:hypothetical protein